MFFRYLATDPHFFVYAVVTMVFSTVLHELAHGWAALWQGDPTPHDSGHMTVDPRVHMGWPSLVLLVMTGMCFGAMPVDRTRFRSRYGDLIVSAAGPLMNLALALVALTACGIWQMRGDEADLVGDNLRHFLWVFGYCNVALAIFNLVPIPPLDGSSALANVHRGYARAIASVTNPSVFLIALFAVLALFNLHTNGLYGIGTDLAGAYLRALHGLFGR